LKEPVLPYADNHVVGEFNGISNGNVNISWAWLFSKFDFIINLSLLFILNWKKLIIFKIY
jgi:hypothetical protein